MSDFNNEESTVIRSHIDKFLGALMLDRKLSRHKGRDVASEALRVLNKMFEHEEVAE